MIVANPNVVTYAYSWQAAAFPIPDYSYGATLSVFDTIAAHKWNSGGPSEIRVGVWNAGAGGRKGFLDVTEEDITTSLQVNVTAAFAFSRGAILKFKENSLDERGKRGTLIFTGATASIRGNVTTSTFAAGKFGIRALSQSLAKEFGKQNIHVGHVRIPDAVSDISTNSRAASTRPSLMEVSVRVVKHTIQRIHHVHATTGILTGQGLSRLTGEDAERYKNNLDVRLDANSIANVGDGNCNSPYSALTLLQNYLNLVEQDRSAWTWELDREYRIHRALAVFSSLSMCSPPCPREVVDPVTQVYLLVISGRSMEIAPLDAKEVEGM